MKKNILIFFIFVFISSMWAKDINIIVIPKGSDHIFWDFIREGVDQAIKEIGSIKMTWRGPAFNDDIDSQIDIVKYYTTTDTDAMIIVPCDKGKLVEPVKKATELGIKVIVIDSALDGDYHLNFIATNNYAAGKMAGVRLASLLNYKGKILVLRTVKGSASTDQRGDGCVDYIKPMSPKIEVIADEYGGGSSGKSYHTALKLLAKYSQIDGIFAVNESSTEGMLRALREKKLAGKIKFIGFDSTDYLLEGLAKQEIEGLIVQNARQMGYLGIKAAVSAVKNEPIKDKTIYTDSIMVTFDNYQNPEIKALLYP